VNPGNRTLTAGDVSGPVVKAGMRRMGTPEEVAAAVLMLAADDASFTSGASLFVDGGAASALI